MNKWNEVYIENRKLDEIFIERYSKTDKKFYEKNCLGLLVEIAELANETKCFKYWSIKKPNKDEVLEEYADCITLTFCLFTKLNIKVNNIPNHYETSDIIELFNEIFNETTNMMYNSSELLAKTIFSNLLYLGELLDFNEDEMVEACYKKMKKIEERLNSDY